MKSIFKRILIKFINKRNNKSIKIKNIYKKIFYYKNLFNKNFLEKNKIKYLKKNIIFLVYKKKKIDEIFMEIKSGVGGDESSIFTFDLYKIYHKFFKKLNWKTKVISFNKTKYGGLKYIILKIKGISVYNKLKFESGVHRIQRNPENDKEKIHTSTSKLAIFKKNTKKIRIKKNDIIFTFFRSSGPGGQHVNKTNSAVRIIHNPSKITVECQDQRNQQKNKKQALKILKYKIFIKEMEKRKLKEDAIKKNLFGFGDRSEKIRTYNYNKRLLIDHRLNESFNLDLIIQGNIDLLIKNFKYFV